VPELTILDTSALGRAVDAAGEGEWVLRTISSERAAACLMVLPEARSIVNTKLRRGVPAPTAEAAWVRLQELIEALDLLDVELRDYEAARDLLGGHPELGAAEAVHLAVALQVARAGVGVTFATADRRQAEVAGRLLDGVRLIA
jgi:predicted nucleic acid-binding protein